MSCLQQGSHSEAVRILFVPDLGFFYQRFQFCSYKRFHLVLSCTIALKDTRKPSSSRCSSPSHYTLRVTQCSHCLPFCKERLPAQSCLILPLLQWLSLPFPFSFSPQSSQHSSQSPRTLRSPRTWPWSLSASQLSQAPPSLSEEHEFSANALTDILASDFCSKQLKKEAIRANNHPDYTDSNQSLT